MLSEGIASRRQPSGDYDVLILGGGINGAGVARDLALRAQATGRPLRVCLAEKGHFASGTSGRNSQLIHGGLRYLKYLEFPLVREALRERATLLEIAPHLVKKQGFLLPFGRQFDRLFYGAGLTLYDLLAGSHGIGKHRQLSRAEALALEPGLAGGDLAGAALFYDCQVNSARFVLENILDAQSAGAEVYNYTRATLHGREGEWWRASIEDAIGGGQVTIRARRVVDTRGPWATDSGRLRLVRGSHIVIPRVNQSENAISYFDSQGRIVFLIPWGSRRNLTLVGTTDVDHAGSADAVAISAEEQSYLQGIVRRLYPGADVDPVATYSSLRPLIEQGAGSATAASRSHRIWIADGVVHVTGGKYTTYRAMAEQAADLVTGTAVHVTASRALPGRGLPEVTDEDAVIARAVGVEMAVRLSDLLRVSTYWAYERRWTWGELEPIGRKMGALLGWDEARLRQEIEWTGMAASGG